MELKPLYSCACCGYLMFTEPSGSFEICSICGWEDDNVQKEDPVVLGANKVSLLEAQINFLKYGRSNPNSIVEVRVPSSDDERDPNWKSIVQ